MIPENIFLSNLPQIDRIVQFIARRNHLSPAEAEEFLSTVRLKLTENDYEIIRKFEGRSSLLAYLTTVIQRMFFQYRVAAWGKWHPSAEAKKLGDAAITLERLINRDGYTFDEAVRMLSSDREPAISVEQLRSIYLRLPPRSPSPKLIDTNSRALAVDPSDPLDAAERWGQAERIGTTLADVMSRLDEEDRVIVRMRFFAGMKVSEIAKALNIDAKKLYRRVDRILGILRDALAERQISSEDVASLLAAGDVDFESADTPGSVRTIKSAGIPGVYVEPATARRTLEELLRESGRGGRK